MSAPHRTRPQEVDPVARRATDQVDPYALIERAEQLLYSEPHEAAVFALRAQSVARARTAESLMARAHYVTGAALMQLGDWSGAIRQLSQAENLYRALDDVPAQCRAIIQAASACCELAEYGDALDGCAQAQRLARQHNDNAAARRALVQQSAVHTMLGDFEAARDSLRSARELPAGSPAYQGLEAFHCGQVYACEGLRAALAGDAAAVARCMAEAERHFADALATLARTTDRAGAIGARAQLGAARCWLGRYEEGLADLRTAVDEAAQGGFTLRSVQVRLEYGYQLVAAGREPDGLAVLGPAAMQADELGDLRRPAETYERLSALYEARGEYRAALLHHKRYVDVKTRLDGRLSTQRAHLHEARAELQTLRSQTEALHARARNLEQSRSRLERLALEDELTGLANRRAFTKELEHWCVRARGGGLRFGLVVCDVDEFKQINDCHSHLTGDAVLKHLGHLIRANLRDTDFAARLGGDEFALLIADSAQGAAVPVVERLIHAVRGWNWAELADGLAVTLSVGLCESTDFGDSSELVRRADEALYASKRAGRDCFNVWDADRA